MEDSEEDAASSLSGSTAVNAGDSSVAVADNVDDPPQENPDSAPFDLLGDFYSQEQLLDLEIFDMREDVPDYPQDFFNDPAFLGVDDTHWLIAIIRRITTWLSRLPVVENLALVIRNRFQQSSEYNILDGILRGMSHAVSSIRPSRTTAFVCGQTLVSALLYNFDLVVSLSRYRATSWRLVLLGRIVVAMLVTSLSAIAARLTRGRGEGDITSTAQFWGGFLAAKALSLVLNQYDIAFERLTISHST